MEVTLPLIWLIFTALFILVGRYFWRVSKRSVPPFEVSKRPGGGSIKVLGSDLDKPLADFVTKFNEHIEKQNAESRKVNRAAAYGLYLAAATSLFSLIIGLIRGQG